ncbi:MAG: chorismate-binding protein, partial [Chloroflexota bacterium]|nr:chorismate-binding protein [Chloroflexota bacterium]
LRTVAVRDGTVIMQAGGGIVYDSTADFEYQETLNKMGAAMRALEVAEELESLARDAGHGARDVTTEDEQSEADLLVREVVA